MTRRIPLASLEKALELRNVGFTWRRIGQVILKDGGVRYHYESIRLAAKRLVTKRGGTMTTVSMRTKFTTALRARGLPEIQQKNRRYVVFEIRPQEEFYFVGVAGALRRGRTGRLSVPVPEALRRQLVGEYEEIAARAGAAAAAEGAQ